MIGDNIPETDIRWQNFLRLEIIDLLFAPVLSQDDIAYLAFLIEGIIYPFLSSTHLVILLQNFIICYTNLNGLAGNTTWLYLNM